MKYFKNKTCDLYLDQGGFNVIKKDELDLKNCL